MFEHTAIGSRVVELSETRSTNTVALELIQSGKAGDGLVITADHQNEGRGQHGSQWQSDPGSNLLVSVVLNLMDFPAQLHFHLNRMISVACHESISEITGHKSQIKWPNDILVNDQKIAGILIENIIRGGVITWSVVGIGINLNQTAFGSYPVPATSVRLLNSLRYKREDALNVLLSKLDKWYRIFILKRFDLIRSGYTDHLFRYQKTAKFADKAGPFEGMITDVLEDGRMVITDATKRRRVYSNKEVEFIFE
jgi:BirA family biotin operon repressor/biotin-[acetyl-CoA-carboxylase] ligase